MLIKGVFIEKHTTNLLVITHYYKHWVVYIFVFPAW